MMPATPDPSAGLPDGKHEGGAGKPGSAWFARWFGEDYKRLSPHRDAAQAAGQVAAMLALPGVRERAALSGSALRVLDVGCGAGRHLAALRASTVLPPEGSPRAVHALGIDLSAVLLRDARVAQAGRPAAVARADMRRLPFPDARFDLVASFFTSFGYFDTPEEDAATLAEFRRVTRPDGLLFLDLPNRAHVVRTLVPEESVTRDGRRADITRTLEGDCVVKRIELHPASVRDGEPERIETHFERVRLYTLDALAPVFARLGLVVAAVLGDERGGPHDPSASPRMSLLLRRAGRNA